MKTFPARRAAFAALASLALLASGGAHALFRTYLSVNGNDANPCTVAAPCRLLPAALAAVDPGGEVWMLDSANFNTSVVPVTKSVTILAIPGQRGSIVGIGGTGISISGAGIEVTLQNLNILSFNGSGDIGVLIGNAGKVTISDCNIFGFKGFGNEIGIWITPGANSPRVTIANTTIRNNHNGVIATGNAHVTITNSRLLSNVANGVWAIAESASRLVNVVVNESVAANNANGFATTGLPQANQFYSAYMYVTRSVASGNTGGGFVIDGGITGGMTVSESSAVDNGTGFSNTNGTFLTRGNNNVTGNSVSNSTGTLTPYGGI